MRSGLVRSVRRQPRHTSRVPRALVSALRGIPADTLGSWGAGRAVRSARAPGRQRGSAGALIDVSAGSGIARPAKAAHLISVTVARLIPQQVKVAGCSPPE